MKIIPKNCPSCSSPLSVKRLHCETCQTEVEGLYPLPPLSGLENEEQAFVLNFIKASGSLKEMSKLMKISYPTVRNRLNTIIDKIKYLETNPGAENE
jgi:hypothetical protein